MITEEDVHVFLLKVLVCSLKLVNLSNTHSRTKTELGPQLSSAHLHPDRQVLSEIFLCESPKHSPVEEKNMAAKINVLEIETKQ